nr:MAG TPA: hypothetical protein [Caudoviricetes sp.]
MTLNCYNIHLSLYILRRIVSSLIRLSFICLSSLFINSLSIFC